jgi:two-component system response regulator NreC
MEERKIRVLCVDDHAFLVDGLRARFALEPDIECVGRLDRADELLAETRKLHPDIVLLDIEMPGADPFEATDELRRLAPGSRVVILSAYVRDHYIQAAFKAGAWGYFSKSEDPDAIVAGIRRVAAGEVAFGKDVAERCKPQRPRKSGGPSADNPAGPPRLPRLSAREQEVLRLIGRGLSRTQIAQVLSRSVKTVDGHRHRLMQKLKLHSRAELIRFAIREGFVEA